MKEFLYKDIASTTGGGESSKMYISIDMYGESAEIVLEKSIRQRFRLSDYPVVERLYEKLNGGNGRRLITLEQLADMMYQAPIDVGEDKDN